jgi:hypothetical protein
MLIIKNNTHVRFRSTTGAILSGEVVGTGIVSLHDGRLVDLVYLVQTHNFGILVVFDAALTEVVGYERHDDQWMFPLE